MNRSCKESPHYSFDFKTWIAQFRRWPNHALQETWALVVTTVIVMSASHTICPVTVILCIAKYVHPTKIVIIWRISPPYRDEVQQMRTAHSILICVGKSVKFPRFYFPLSTCWIHIWQHKTYISISIIYEFLNVTGTWYRSSWETGIRVS